MIFEIANNPISNRVRAAIEKTYPLAEDDVLATIYNIYKDAEKRISTDVITTILMHLYDYDYGSLRADLASAVIFGDEDEDKKIDRLAVMMALMRSIKFYCNGDYSPILDFLREAEESDYGHDQLPFH